MDLSIAITVRAALLGAVVSKTGSFAATVTGTALIGEVQTIATAATALNLGSVGTPVGFVYIENLDPVNFVLVDSANTFDKFPQKLGPGQMILLSPQTVTIYLKADTAAVNVMLVAADAQAAG